MDQRDSELLSIDVIIPVSDVWMIPYIKNCYHSIKSQRYNGVVKVIVVHTSLENANNDVCDISSFCRDIGATLIFLNQEDPAFNIAKAYNRGAESGVGDIIICMDCDIYMHETTFDYVLQSSHSGKVGVLPVVGTAYSADHAMFSKPDTCKLDIGTWTRLFGRARWKNFANGNAVFPRIIYEHIGGYDERYFGWGGADNDIINRAGKVIEICNLINIGCPMVIHQNHKVRQTKNSLYTVRNRSMLGRSTEIFVNQETLGKRRLAKNSFNLIFSESISKSQKNK